MVLGISLECLGLRIDRRKRDRVLLALGWSGFVAMWLFKFRLWFLFVPTAVSASVFVFLACGVAAAATVVRERRMQRLEAVALPPSDGEQPDCRFRCRQHARKCRVLCEYFGNDIAPVLVSMACWAGVVCAMGVCIDTLSKTKDTLVVKGMWIGALCGAIATFTVLLGVAATFRTPNLHKRTIGWQACCAVFLVLFYGGAMAGFAACIGAALGAMAGNFIKFFDDAMAFAWVSVGGIFVVCCLLPAVFIKYGVCRGRQNKVVGFNAELNAGGRLEPIPTRDTTDDDYVSLFEFPLEDMEPYVLVALLKGALQDMGMDAVERCKCSCLQRLRPESRATVYAREFASPVNPLFADALAAGRVVAARGVLAQGGQVNGIHEGKNMLMHAIDGGSMPCFRMLLDDRRVDINRAMEPIGTSDDGLSALHYAAQTGKVQFVQALLAHAGCNYRVATSTHRRTALYMAAMQGHIDVVTAFLGITKPKRAVQTLLTEPMADGSTMVAVVEKLARKGVGPPMRVAAALYSSMQGLGLRVPANVAKRIDKFNAQLA